MQMRQAVSSLMTNPALMQQMMDPANMQVRGGGEGRQGRPTCR